MPKLSAKAKQLKSLFTKPETEEDVATLDRTFTNCRVSYVNALQGNLTVRATWFQKLSNEERQLILAMEYLNCQIQWIIDDHKISTFTGNKQTVRYMKLMRKIINEEEQKWNEYVSFYNSVVLRTVNMFYLSSHATRIIQKWEDDVARREADPDDFDDVDKPKRNEDDDDDDDTQPEQGEEQFGEGEEFEQHNDEGVEVEEAEQQG
jgi:hypothetical protein